MERPIPTLFMARSTSPTFLKSQAKKAAKSQDVSSRLPPPPALTIDTSGAGSQEPRRHTAYDEKTLKTMRKGMRPNQVVPHAATSPRGRATAFGASKPATERGKRAPLLLPDIVKVLEGVCLSNITLRYEQPLIQGSSERNMSFRPRRFASRIRYSLTGGDDGDGNELGELNLRPSQKNEMSELEKLANTAKQVIKGLRDSFRVSMFPLTTGLCPSETPHWARLSFVCCISGIIFVVFEGGRSWVTCLCCFHASFGAGFVY